MPNPILAWVATLNAGSFISHGQSMTVTVNITQGWEVRVQIGARYGSGVSLAAAVFAHSTEDGGANFDTEPMYALAIPALASVNKTISLRLPTGMYAIRVLVSSPSVTVFVLTQEVITAIS